MRTSRMLCLRLLMIMFFFFFKQKTAYEMRISDWSSDVCSSDLQGVGGQEQQQDDIEPRWHILVVYGAPQLAIECAAQRGHEPEETDETKLAEEQQRHAPGASTRAAEPVPARMSDHQTVLDDRQRLEVLPDPPRSEEHTSELQSLMRISYAVFCLKKKKHEKHHNY